MAGKEPEALAIIHRIRERQYRQTLRQTAAQQIGYVREKARPIVEKLGLHVVSRMAVRTR
jgi:hypothetical protein